MAVFVIYYGFTENDQLKQFIPPKNQRSNRKIK